MPVLRNMVTDFLPVGKIGDKGIELSTYFLLAGNRWRGIAASVGMTALGSARIRPRMPVLRSRNRFALPVAVPIVQGGKRTTVHAIDIERAL